MITLGAALTTLRDLRHNKRLQLTAARVLKEPIGLCASVDRATFNIVSPP